jgi:hypothetical protein
MSMNIAKRMTKDIIMSPEERGRILGLSKSKAADTTTKVLNIPIHPSMTGSPDTMRRSETTTATDGNIRMASSLALLAILSSMDSLTKSSRIAGRIGNSE